MTSVQDLHKQTEYIQVVKYWFKKSTSFLFMLTIAKNSLLCKFSCVFNGQRIHNLFKNQMIKNQFNSRWFWRQAIIVMQSDILILVDQTVKRPFNDILVDQTVKRPFNDIAMLPWDLSAFTTLLSLLQCSLGTWLSPVPLGLEGLSPVPFELEELSPFPLQGYPWRRGPRVSLPEDTGRVVGEGTLVYVSNVGLNKNRNKAQKMKRHNFYFVFY